MADFNLSEFINANIFDSSQTATAESVLKSKDSNVTENLTSKGLNSIYNVKRTAFEYERITEKAKTRRLGFTSYYAQEKLSRNDSSISYNVLNNLSQTKKKTVSRRYNNSNITPTTRNLNTSGFLNQQENIIACIYENPKGIATKIGMSVLNYTTGELTVTEYIDSQIFIRTINRLHIFEPNEILIPVTSVKPILSKMATLLKLNVKQNGTRNNSSVKIIEMTSKSFDSNQGLNDLEKYSLKNTNESNLEDIKNKTYLLNSISGIISYVDKVLLKKSQSNFNKFKNLRIKFETVDNTLLIDYNTIVALELVENKYTKNGKSVLKMLDSTITKMGKRSFKSNLLQPMTEKNNIELRQEAVKDLINDKDLLKDIRKSLGSFQDLDILLAKLLSLNSCSIHPSHKINYVLCLKSTLQNFNVIKLFLKETEFTSKLINEITTILDSCTLKDIKGIVNTYINDDCCWATSPLEIQNQKCYAVRAGTNGLLDISRQIYQKLTDEVMEHIRKLEEEYELNIEHKFENSRGFYVKFKKNDDISNINDLPDTFINKVDKRKWIECTTLKLCKINARLKEVISEIILISENVINECLMSIASKISTLFMASEAISILDLLCSFAFNHLEYNYCIPKISNKLIVKGARHPILEHVIKNMVPNDIKCLQSSSSVQIITGVNMSGKSVFLKQIALFTIMAQMGSSLPATDAIMPIYTKLHARICNESLELTSSNFVFEMKEMAYFLNDITPSTLLIIDELGRNSSIQDGFVISFSITEYLIKKKCTVFLSTHFNKIANILKFKPRVLHQHMNSILTSNNTIEMKYTLGNSIEKIPNPGIHIVSKFFDQNIIDDSFKIANTLEVDSTTKQTREDIEKRKNIAQKIKRVNELVEILNELANDENQNIDLEILRDIQAKFIQNFEI